MAEKDCVLIFVIIGVFLLFAFFIAWLAAFLDDKDKEVETVGHF